MCPSQTLRLLVFKIKKCHAQVLSCNNFLVKDSRINTFKLGNEVNKVKPVNSLFSWLKITIASLQN